jgi:hypothetical protein
MIPFFPQIETCDFRMLAYALSNRQSHPLEKGNSNENNCSLGACRTYGDRSDNSAGRGQILPVLQVNSHSIDQKSGEIWTAQADSQQIHHKSDRLLDPFIAQRPCGLPG